MIEVKAHSTVNRLPHLSQSLSLYPTSIFLCGERSHQCSSRPHTMSTVIGFLGTKSAWFPMIVLLVVSPVKACAFSASGCFGMGSRGCGAVSGPGEEGPPPPDFSLYGTPKAADASRLILPIFKKSLPEPSHYWQVLLERGDGPQAA